MVYGLTVPAQVDEDVVELARLRCAAGSHITSDACEQRQRQCVALLTPTVPLSCVSTVFVAKTVPLSYGHQAGPSGGARSRHRSLRGSPPPPSSQRPAVAPVVLVMMEHPDNKA